MMRGKKSAKGFFVVLLVVSGILGGVGQFLFKDALSIPSALLPLLLLGIIAYGLATLLYFYVLGRSHLSWSYGFVGLSYIAASVLASLFLGEQISPLRWVGILVIVLGTVVIGLS
jgi:drug/metabolite transporter (DMT)-like permease